MYSTGLRALHRRTWGFCNIYISRLRVVPASELPVTQRTRRVILRQAVPSICYKNQPCPTNSLTLHPLVRCTKMTGILLTALTLLLAHLCSGKATVDQAILDLENSNSSLLQYPTQFTQGIMPKMIHSHNDCAFSAYLSACRSIFMVYAISCPDRLARCSSAHGVELWRHECGSGCVA